MKTPSCTSSFVIIRRWFFSDDRVVHLGSPETSHILAGGFGPGSGTHQLRFPYSFVIESDQNALIIADWGNHRIVRWVMHELQGEVLVPAQEQLNGPTDVILDRAGDSLIICDRGHRRIVRWSLQRKASEVEVLLGDIAGWSLALDGERYLYISDTDHHAVRRYRLDTMGEGVIVAGGHGQGAGLHQLNQPTYLFVDRHGNVYVTDTGNHRVMKWNRKATVGMMVARGFPRGLYVDAAETLYMADYGNHRVVRWAKGATEGSVVSEVQPAGDDNVDETFAPWSLVGDEAGYLYVGDHNTHRVQRFLLSNWSDVGKNMTPGE